MRKMLVQVQLIAMVSCIVFLLHRRVEAAPANIAVGLPRLNWKAPAHKSQLALKNAQIEAEIERTGGSIPGGIPAINRSIVALLDARAEFAANSPQNAEFLAQMERDIRALEHARDRLAHSPPKREH